MSKPSDPLLPLPFVLESLAAPGVVPLKGSWVPPTWHRCPACRGPVATPGAFCDACASRRTVVDSSPESPMLALNGRGRARVSAGERERKPSPSRREIEAWGECVCWDYEDENAPCTCGART